jgi:hypothetical protein
MPAFVVPAVPLSFSGALLTFVLPAVAVAGMVAVVLLVLRAGSSGPEARRAVVAPLGRKEEPVHDERAA